MLMAFLFLQMKPQKINLCKAKELRAEEFDFKCTSV